MNHKYILKLEWGPLEQAFKWDEYDFTGLEDFLNFVNSSAIIPNSAERFRLMLKDIRIS